MERDSFVFYRSYLDGIKKLPEDEQLKAAMAIFDYALDGKETELTSLASIVYVMAKHCIDTNFFQSEETKNER